MIIGVLVRNAMLKTTKRFAFWAALLMFAGLVTIIFGGLYYQSQTHGFRAPIFSLPDGWDMILGGPMMTALIFGSGILILLVSSEFMWRTARQNVIDGLSKEQLFGEKLLLIPFVVFVFLGTYLVIGGGLAWAGTDRATMVGPWIHGPQLALLGGVALAFVGFASTALFAALAIRNPGSAIGVWFIYAVLVERLLTSALTGFSKKLEPVVRFFPINVFNHLMRPVEYDATLYQKAVAQATRSGLTLDVWGRGLIPTALVWIALFLGSAFFWFRTRDL